ncbi:MAG: vanadium-dependent haloperoxidase [Longimicrobiales bacterium]
MTRQNSARLVLAAALAASACSDQVVTPEPVEPVVLSAERGGGRFEETATATWHERTYVLLSSLPNGSHAPASRILTYLSIAQYRAVRSAQRDRGHKKPSERAAVGAASVAVLSSFFPASAASLEAQLDADIAADDEKNRDAEDGEAIGRSVGAAVLAQAAADGFNTLNPGVPPVGPGYWVSSGAAIARSLYGTRPFFLRSTTELRSAPPPAFGSPRFLADLAEIRRISDTRTPEQLAIAQTWNHLAAPFTPGNNDRVAVELIRKYDRSEKEAAYILAKANAAAFDAQIGCFDTKFAYWFLRPSHADPAITLPIGLPNHPSYPSAHQCITAAFSTYLIVHFPRDRELLESNMELAGLSRMYGGIHYRFDIEAGALIGRRAALRALFGRLD